MCDKNGVRSFYDAGVRIGAPAPVAASTTLLTTTPAEWRALCDAEGVCSFYDSGVRIGSVAARGAIEASEPVETAAEDPDDLALGDEPDQEALYAMPLCSTEVDDAYLEKIILRGGTAVGKSPLMPPNPDLETKPEVVRALLSAGAAVDKADNDGDTQTLIAAGRGHRVGAAAPQFPPAGAFGANPGLQDAHNLCWKLIRRQQLQHPVLWYIIPSPSNFKIWSQCMQKFLNLNFFLFAASVFINPVKWMEPEIRQNLSGRLYCPNCQTRVGQYSWILGKDCGGCEANVNPSFSLDITEIIFRTKNRFLQSNQREAVVV